MKRIVLLALICLSQVSLAVVPTAKQAKSVTDYFFNGKSKGPMLLEFTPCLEVETRKDHKLKFECTKTAKATLKKGTKITAWTSWLVPKEGLYDDIMIQFVHDGMVRRTLDIKLNEGIRKRAYRSQVLSKKGTWEIRVLRKRKTIASSKVKVI